MPDDSLSPADKAVMAFFEIIAFALGWAGVDRLLAGTSFLIVIPIFIATGLTSYAGFIWPQVKPRISVTVISTIEKLAVSYRFRVGAALFFGFIVIAYVMVSFHSLRSDLDTYVMPRVLTNNQISSIRKDLSPSDNPHTVINVVVNSADRESVEYASQLTNAIVGGGWEANLNPLNPWAPDSDTHPYGNAFRNIYLALDQGINIRISKVGQDQNPDPKHPRPEDILSMAFQRAGINCGTGSAPNGDRYALTVEVGRRPSKLETQPSLRSKIAQWLERWIQ